MSNNLTQVRKSAIMISPNSTELQARLKQVKPELDQTAYKKQELIKMGFKRRECFKIKRSGPRIDVAIRENISHTVGDICVLNKRFLSTAATNLLKRTIGVFFPGVEACPPAPRAINFKSVQPFSPTPTIA